MKFTSNYEIDKKNIKIFRDLGRLWKEHKLPVIAVSGVAFAATAISITAIAVGAGNHQPAEGSVSSSTVDNDSFLAASPDESYSEDYTESYMAEPEQIVSTEVVDITLSCNDIPEKAECNVNLDVLYITAGALSDNELDKYEEGGVVDLYALGDEYARLAIANVDSYVNVRSAANTEGEIVGYIYNGAVGTVEEIVDGEDGNWFKITSGNVTGFIKSEYFIAGNDAAEVANEYVTNYATVLCDRLNVREKADVNSNRIGYVEANEKLVIKSEENGWYKVVYSEDKEGYVSSDYVSKSEEFIYARTIEEDNAIKEEARKQKEREQQKANAQNAELLTRVDVTTPPAEIYSSTSDLRQSIIANAMQYLGNRYVMGGSTLAGGTDCSGFTSLLYAQYGYALSRTPQGQLAANGRSVDYSQAQPGDIICYSGNGRTCTHVAIYIGNGQIIHSSTPRRGVIIGSVTSCGQIVGIKNVID